MDSYLVNIDWLSEALEGVRIWTYDIKPIDSATLFGYYGQGGKFQID